MAKSTTYLCDVCKKEMIKSHSPNRIHVSGRLTPNGSANMDRTYEDVCNFCVHKFWQLIKAIELKGGVE